MRNILLLLVAILLSACAVKTMRDEPAAPKEKALYEQGLKALVKKDYSTATNKFNQLLNDFPSTRWLSGAYYNLGLAYEGQTKHAEAAEKYKKVIEFYQGVHTRDEADALYRLSICYEYIGDDTKMVLTLLELDTHSEFLNRNTGNVELPARLAAAYARMGNLAEAKVYYSRAELGLKKLRRVRLTEDTLVWLPKTLYSMGKLAPLRSDFTDEDFKNYVGTIERSQSWLLRASELGGNEWSKKAAAELTTGYNDAWNFIANFPVPDGSDKLQALKIQQQKQKSMSEALDRVLDKIKVERLPSTQLEPELPQVTEIFKTVALVQKQVDATIQARDVQDQKTYEAHKREGLKRSIKPIGQ
ncbi:MAG: outer membrane protein assembly factor BamD [Oligoflexia bacterium]|nr:outer membrane protein assembly factor BamD [Oligoflexia bacterium]